MPAGDRGYTAFDQRVLTDGEVTSDETITCLLPTTPRVDLETNWTARV